MNMVPCRGCRQALDPQWRLCPYCGAPSQVPAPKPPVLTSRPDPAGEILTRLNPGDLFAGRFRLELLLGRGGMGCVFKVMNETLGTAQALKILSPTIFGDAMGQERFMREARICTKIRHRNVVGVLDVGVDPLTGFHYLVMDYCEGETLFETIRRGRLVESEAVSLTLEILDALGEAHRLGIVHRDIKPSNLLVYPKDGGRAVKVLDFGLARAVDTSAKAAIGQSMTTLPGSRVGTPEYFSPEQAAGEPVDARSDLFSTGLVFYEMLTGHRPWDALGIMRLLGEPQRPPRIPPQLGVSKLTEAALIRALEADPNRRFQTAAEFSKAISSQKTAEAADSWSLLEVELSEPVSEMPIRPVASMEAPRSSNWADLPSSRKTSEEIFASDPALHDKMTAIPVDSDAAQNVKQDAETQIRPPSSSGGDKAPAPIDGPTRPHKIPSAALSALAADDEATVIPAANGEVTFIPAADGEATFMPVAARQAESLPALTMGDGAATIPGRAQPAPAIPLPAMTLGDGAATIPGRANPAIPLPAMTLGDGSATALMGHALPEPGEEATIPGGLALVRQMQIGASPSGAGQVSSAPLARGAAPAISAPPPPKPHSSPMAPSAGGAAPAATPPKVAHPQPADPARPPAWNTIPAAPPPSPAKPRHAPTQEVEYEELFIPPKEAGRGKSAEALSMAGHKLSKVQARAAAFDAPWERRLEKLLSLWPYALGLALLAGGAAAYYFWFRT